MSDDASLIVAEAEARRAVALSAESADAHRALAGVLYLQGQFQQVLEELLSTAELHGADDNLERFIGMTFDTLGDIPSGHSPGMIERADRRNVQARLTPR